MYTLFACSKVVDEYRRYFGDCDKLTFDKFFAKQMGNPIKTEEDKLAIDEFYLKLINKLGYLKDLDEDAELSKKGDYKKEIYLELYDPEDFIWE